VKQFSETEIEAVGLQDDVKPNRMYFKVTGVVHAKTYTIRFPDYKNPTDEDLMRDGIVPQREVLGTIVTPEQRVEVRRG
jgi:hypothetical protein